jgi:hypothetical protein
LYRRDGPQDGEGGRLDRGGRCRRRHGKQRSGRLRGLTARHSLAPGNKASQDQSRSLAATDLESGE